MKIKFIRVENGFNTITKFLPSIFTKNTYKALLFFYTFLLENYSIFKYLHPHL
jgi:hypothetical protein